MCNLYSLTKGQSAIRNRKGDRIRYVFRIGGHEAFGRGGHLVCEPCERRGRYAVARPGGR